MNVDTILSPGRTHCGAPGSSKKRVLENIAEFICKDNPTFNHDQLFENLLAREKLGSTGLGNGIAIPHCRITACKQITGCLIKLEQAVDFDAIDGKPVDILFVLLVPDQAHDEHLTMLAKLAENFNNPQFCQQLRNANSNQALFEAAIQNP